MDEAIKATCVPVVEAVEAGTIEAPAPVERKLVMVAPFADDSPARDQEYFCRGAAQEIIHALIRVNIPVVMPTRVSQPGIPSTASNSIQEPNAAVVVAGSVRKSANLYRITIHLIDKVSGRYSWSKTLDRVTVDVFSLQEEIAMTVAEALSGNPRVT